MGYFKIVDITPIRIISMDFVAKYLLLRVNRRVFHGIEMASRNAQLVMSNMNPLKLVYPIGSLPGRGFPACSISSRHWEVLRELQCADPYAWHGGRVMAMSPSVIPTDTNNLPE